MSRALICTIAAAVAVCGVAAPAPADNGGSGTYTATGTSYAFDLLNTGTTAWQYLQLVGPAGTVFVGAASQGEITVPCSKAQPNGLPAQLECGPLSGSGLAPGAGLGLIATLTAPVPCGSTFELDVSSNGATAFVPVAELAQAGSCTGAPPSCSPAELAVGAATSALASLEDQLRTYSRAWSAASKALQSGVRGSANADVQRLRGARLLDHAGVARIRARLAAVATALERGPVARARTLFAGTGPAAASIVTVRRSASAGLAQASAALTTCRQGR